jgi:N-methylhydantoinase A
MTQNTWRVGCDIGGTFTDFVAFDGATASVHAEKRLTTPDDPSRALIDGLVTFRERLGDYLPDVATFIHGTTLVINALIQRAGARVGLIATDGFSDIVEMRREVRYDSYDLFADFPSPLAERPYRLGVRERVLADGSVHRPLDEAHARAQIAALAGLGVEAFAVSLLHAYANPAHERRLRELILKAVPDAFVSLSSEVLPEIREFERTTATTANAFVQPLVSRYLDRMLGRLGEVGCGGTTRLMLSNGGLSSVDTARAFPIRAVESGPAAGGMAAQYFSRLLNIPDLLSFDMGGTTAKSVLVKNGRVTISTDCEVARVHRFKKGSGIPLKLPFVDLLDVGAGGGSIARIGAMGLIQVGPDSAGSVPGPVCYGRGGTEPTVTDADLLLGYLNASYFLGGTMRLDLDGAHAALANRLGARLGLSALEAAWGVHDIVNENMAAAAKIHLAEKGEAPATLAMIAFGGAGPLHAVGLAAKLGIRTVVIPPWAGILSAIGFFAAPLSFDVTATYKVPLGALDRDHLNRLLTSMRADVTRFLAHPTEAIAWETELALRYVGQGFEVPVILSVGEGLPSPERLKALFEDTYRRLYGRTYPDVELELMNLHVTGRIEGEPLVLSRPQAGGSLANARKGERPAWSAAQRSMLAHAVFERTRLPVGTEIGGPAIIEERECTTLIGAGMGARIHESGALIITLPGA